MQIGISLQNNWGVEDVQSLVQLLVGRRSGDLPQSGSTTMCSMQRMYTIALGGSPITNR